VQAVLQQHSIEIHQQSDAMAAMPMIRSLSRMPDRQPRLG
jgi:hypothetical protein